MVLGKTSGAETAEILKYFLRYGFKSMPKMILAFFTMKMIDLFTQLMIAVSIVMTIQLKFLETPPEKISFLTVIVEKFDFNTLPFTLEDIFVTLFVVFILLNTLTSYACKRILTRISVLSENDFSGNVIASVTEINLPRYRKLSVIFPSFDKQNILKLAQQNTRLVGIVVRNLVSAFFSMLQLAVVFIVLISTGSHVASLIVFVAFVGAFLSLIQLFRIGINHSVNYPESSRHAGLARKALLEKVLSGSQVDQQKELIEEYNSNTKIQNAMKHYEDRFKILDQGNLAISLLTGIALITLMFSFISFGKVDSTMAIGLLFIGNLLFRTLQQLSGFFVVIGRLYQQVWEVWKYQTCIAEPLEPVKSDAKFLTTIYDSEDTKASFDIQAGSVLAVCQQRPTDIFSLFQLVETSNIANKATSAELSKVTIADANGLAIFRSKLTKETLSSTNTAFEDIITRLKLDLKPTILDDARLIHSYATCADGITVIDFQHLKDIPPPLLKMILSQPLPGALIFQGRSPLLGLKMQGDNIPTTILAGNQIKILSTKDALSMTGKQLTLILALKPLTDKHVAVLNDETI